MSQTQNKIEYPPCTSTSPLPVKYSSMFLPQNFSANFRPFIHHKPFPPTKLLPVKCIQYNSPHCYSNECNNLIRSTYECLNYTHEVIRDTLSSMIVFRHSVWNVLSVCLLNTYAKIKYDVVSCAIWA